MKMVVVRNHPPCRVRRRPSRKPHLHHWVPPRKSRTRHCRNQWENNILVPGVEVDQLGRLELLLLLFPWMPPHGRDCSCGRHSVLETQYPRECLDDSEDEKSLRVVATQNEDLLVEFWWFFVGGGWFVGVFFARFVEPSAFGAATPVIKSLQSKRMSS